MAKTQKPRKRKIFWIIKRNGRTVGKTSAVSEAQAVTNFWWRRDAQRNSIRASEVKENRFEYTAAPMPGQLKLFEQS